jgi:thioredoxin reductase (NADPH)
MSLSYDIDNYPGYVHATGSELTKNMLDQLKAIDHELIRDSIKKIEKNNDTFVISGQQEEYQAKNILLAIGSEKNKLNVPGESELIGRGVSYCSTCDGFFFKNKTVAVIGGGDAAVEASVFLSEIAEKVYIIIRRDQFRADPDWQERLMRAKNVDIITKANVQEIIGKEKVEIIKLDKDNQEIEVDGVFIEIGETPSSVLFDDLKLKRDKDGYVIVDEKMKTSAEGVWAAGDSTTASNKFRQIVTACAEGAIAASTIYARIRDSR